MKKVVSMLLMSSLVVSSLLANNSEVVLSSSSFQEKMVKAENGAASLRLVPVAQIVPGDIVVYQNSITNQGQKSATYLVVTNPIPEHMEYIEDSTLCLKEKGCRIQYSIDGGETFKNRNQLVVKSSDGTKRLAEAKEITTIRWVIDQLPSGSREKVAFKARLK